MPDWRRRLTLFLAVLGPGIITANVDNDAGGIATYSIAGAHFGYSLLWTMLPIGVALIVVQEMSARLGAITGKGLGELIRENYGLRMTFYILSALFVTDIGNTVAEFAGWAAALEIFGVPRWVSVPIGAAAVWWLVVKGNYKTVEKIFLIACTVYLTYVVSAFFAKPVWKDVIRQTVEPHIESNAAWILMIIGLVGTTIAPWMQFYLQSSIVEKRIDAENYALSRWDVVVGCAFASVVAFFIIVACGATLFPRGIRIEGAAEAAVALEPLAGKWAKALFASLCHPHHNEMP
ncbi:MAG TPA: Nramp family divalent metal transporter, partial [Thermoanaerobaculia bacterium]|nr:Nramp family divalent metal transporter [Thermoanaerobaculia bacterium]